MPLKYGPANFLKSNMYPCLFFFAPGTILDIMEPLMYKKCVFLYISDLLCKDIAIFFT